MKAKGIEPKNPVVLEWFYLAREIDSGIVHSTTSS